MDDRNKQRSRRAVLALLALWLPVAASSCSIKKMAVNKVGDALAESGTTFTADDDPELIEAALPFSLKLMESLLAESPDHEGLLTSVASGFAQFSFAFVHTRGDELEARDLDAALAEWERARRLYARARDYGLRGLELRYAGLSDALTEDPVQAVAATALDDVPLLYWTAVSWAGVIVLSKDDPDAIGDLPMVDALIKRALELDESFDHGAIHNFLITYEMSVPGGAERAVARAREHFERVLELTAGELVSPFVALAENVAVSEQNRAEFEELLDRALAVDLEARPEWKLANTIYQRRARWLRAQGDHLILD
jgi:predicted anti-sigma-YlaC factor YlaD